MIRRRAQAGAKVIVVSTEKTDLAHHANAILLQLKAGTDTALLAGLMSAALAEGAAPAAKGLDALKKSLVSVDSAAATSGVSAEQITAAAKAYAAAKQPVVVLGTGISANEEASLQALNLALLKNAGVMPLMLEANALGVMQMGCLTGMAAGFAKAKKAGKSYDEMKKGMKALFIAGNMPDADFKADMLIVQASHTSALTDKADLVLPMAALYEKQGSIVNTYGSAKVFAQAQAAAGEAKDGVEICRIGQHGNQQDQGVQGKGHCGPRQEGEGRKNRGRRVQAGKGRGRSQALWRIGNSAAYGHEPGNAGRFGRQQGHDRKGRRPSEVTLQRHAKADFTLSASKFAAMTYFCNFP